jgi:hypothetical protein
MATRLSGAALMFVVAACGGAPLGVASPHEKLTPAQFAERLYPISVYTGERDALGRLLEAEIELVASRLLARRLAAARGTVPPKSPAGWDAMLAAFRGVIAPVAHRHLRERDTALHQAGLEERSLYVRTYEQLVLQPKRRNIQFADGSSDRAASNQVADIPQILGFHERAAATKWRLLWPELRVYAAHLAAYQHRIAADPGLGAGLTPQKRAGALAQRIGGRAVGFAEWMRLRENRLHYTLGGLHRFSYPLGTTLMSSGEAPTMTIGERAGGGVTIASQEGGFVYGFLDTRWDADLSRRLSSREVKQIDDALTAEYDEKKDRWFAPLELEWDAHLSISRQIQVHPEMRALFARFASEAAAAADAAWVGWGGALDVEAPASGPVPRFRAPYGAQSR